MGNSTSKQIGKIDGDQALRKAYNVEDSTLSVNGFIVGKIGHKVTVTIGTTNVANDTERFTFTDESPPSDNPLFPGPITLYIIDVVYTDATRTTFLSAERVG